MDRLTYFNDATGMYRLKPLTYTEDAVQVLAIYENLGTPKELRELKEKATAIKSDGFSDHLLNMGYTKGMKDGYAKAIEEFAEAVKKKYPICTNDFGMVINESAHKTIDEIAKELKGE